jgi:CheY-like chemotaxis protein
MEHSILIVDDEISIRSAMATWFKLRGFAVTEAVDGLDAVEQCGKAHFDVITLDLEMPRMDGLEALPLIRRALPDTPVLVVTGYPRDTEEAISRGASTVIIKPVTMRTLEEKVRVLVEASEQAPEAPN